MGKNNDKVRMKLDDGEIIDASVDDVESIQLQLAPTYLEKSAKAKIMLDQWDALINIILEIGHTVTFAQFGEFKKKINSTEKVNRTEMGDVKFNSCLMLMACGNSLYAILSTKINEKTREQLQKILDTIKIHLNIFNNK